MSFLVLAGAWASAAPSDDEPGYLIRNYTSDDGLRNETIFNVAQDADGYLWCATYGGLARFDGVRFTVYDPDTTPSLGSRVITSVWADRQGRLWIGNQDFELVLRERGEFRRVEMPLAEDGRPSLVQNVSEDRSGRIWIDTRADERFPWEPGATNPGLQVLTKGEPKIVTTTGMSEDWFSLPGFKNQTIRYGLMRSGRFSVRADPQGVADFSSPVCFLRQAGGVWMVEGSGRERLLRALRPDGTVSGPRALPRFGEDPPSSFVEDQAGNIWVGFREQGVWRIDPDGQTREFSRRDGLASANIRQLFVGREGNVWAATDGGGLSRFTPRHFKMFGLAEGLPSEIIYAVVPAPAATGGGMWVASHGGGVQRLRGASFTYQSGFDPFPWALHVAPDKTLWVGDLMAGLGHLKDGRASLIFPGRQISAICDDSAGGGWAGGSGLVRWRGNTALLVTNWPDSLTISSLACGKNGELWLGTINGGLWCGENGSFHRVDPPGDSRCGEIHALYLDGAGTLWLGTGGRGLVQFKEGRFTGIDVADGLADRSIRGIAEDLAGHFWFTSLGGIFRVSRHDLEAFCAGRSAGIVCRQFDREDGLATSQGTSSSQPKIARSDDGRMWFATMRGLACTDPLKIPVNTNPPPVVVEQLLADGAPVRLTGEHPVVAAGTRRIEIHYTALSLTAPGKVRFRHRLEERGDKWTDAGAQRFAAFDRLEPGEHRFRVIACNNDGVWNEAGAPMTFVVQPFWWQKLWFRGVALGAAIVLISGMVRSAALRKVRRRLVELERQQAIDRERTRIARDIHDDVGSALTQLTLLASPQAEEPEETGSTAARLGQITELSREIVGKLDELVWTVSPRHDTTTGLVDYLCHYAEATLRAAGLQLRYHIAPDISMLPVGSDRRHQLFLAFKEALTNVIRHSNAKTVHLRIHCEDRRLWVTVEDDGRGFDPAAVGANGEGLDNMCQRLAGIGGNAAFTRPETGGTCVKFNLPLAEPS